MYLGDLKYKISITLEDYLIKELKELAEDDDRSLSQYINITLKKYLKLKPISLKTHIPTNRLFDEAIEDLINKYNLNEAGNK